MRWVIDVMCLALIVERRIHDRRWFGFLHVHLPPFIPFPHRLYPRKMAAFDFVNKILQSRLMARRPVLCCQVAVDLGFPQPQPDSDYQEYFVNQDQLDQVEVACCVTQAQA